LPGSTFSFTPPQQGTLTKKISYVKHILMPDSVETTLLYES
jgi:hypothetical protein